jgi:hypothetical protein
MADSSRKVQVKRKKRRENAEFNQFLFSVSNVKNRVFKRQDMPFGKKPPVHLSSVAFQAQSLNLF